MELYTYQQQAVDQLTHGIANRARIPSNLLRSLFILQAPCGAGKTIMALNIIQRLPNPVFMPIIYFNTAVINSGRLRDSAIIYVNSSVYYQWIEEAQNAWPGVRILGVHNQNTFAEFTRLFNLDPTREGKLYIDSYDLIIVRSSKITSQTESKQIQLISAVAELTISHIFTYLVVDDADCCQGSSQPIPLSRIMLALTASDFCSSTKYHHAIEGEFIHPTINRCIKYPGIWRTSFPQSMAAMYHRITPGDMAEEVKIPPAYLFDIYIKWDALITLQRLTNSLSERLDILYNRELSRENNDCAGDNGESSNSDSDNNSDSSILSYLTRDVLTEAISEIAQGNINSAMNILNTKCHSLGELVMYLVSQLRLTDHSGEVLGQKVARITDRVSGSECMICNMELAYGFVLWNCCYVPLCAQCTKEITRTSSSCPYCRTVVSSDNLTVLNIQPKADKDKEPGAIALEVSCPEFPVVEILYNAIFRDGLLRHPNIISIEDSTDSPPSYMHTASGDFIPNLIPKESRKVIIFAHGSEIAETICKIFSRRADIPILYLVGSADIVRSKIRRFAEDPKCNILVVNSMTSCWGANMPFVDDAYIICGDKRQELIEQQCVGRLQRPGRTHSANIYYIICSSAE